MTTLESTTAIGLASASISTADDVVVAAPLVARALPLVVARLIDRYPSAPAGMVEHHVRAAAARVTSEARIHDYLAILIERAASASLRTLLCGGTLARPSNQMSPMDGVPVPADWSAR